MPLPTSRRLLRLLLPGLAMLLAGCAGTATVTVPRPVAGPPQPGLFLVAGRHIPDPRFRETVILLVQHDQQHGTLGLVLNRPSGLRLGELLGASGELRNPGYPIGVGGPVALELVSFLARSVQPLERATPVRGDVWFSLSRTTLEVLLENDTPGDRLRPFLGHAGWDPGQLQTELDGGAWHLMQAPLDLAFQADAQGLWPLLIQRADPPGRLAAGGRRADGAAFRQPPGA